MTSRHYVIVFSKREGPQLRFPVTNKGLDRIPDAADDGRRKEGRLPVTVLVVSGTVDDCKNLIPVTRP